MSDLKELPDLSIPFAKMKLLIDIREKADYNTGIGFSIIAAIDNKEFSSNEILSYITDQTLDNPNEMQKAIGIDLTNEVINLHNKTLTDANR